jgi:hypothetical protein
VSRLHVILANTLVAAVLCSAPLAAQSVPDTRDVAGAYRAAYRMALRRPNADSTRIVPDTATMYAKFATCNANVPEAAPMADCTLTGSTGVVVLTV